MCYVFEFSLRMIFAITEMKHVKFLKIYTSCQINFIETKEHGTKKKTS